MPHRIVNRPYTHQYRVAMTPEQREIVGLLGGAAWVREQIDKAAIRLSRLPATYTEADILAVAREGVADMGALSE